MKQFAVVLLLAIAAGCSGKKDAAPEPPKPSRAASEGCEWATYEARGLGVSFFYEKCRQPGFALSEEGNAVVLRPAGTDEAHRIVEVFTKRQMQPIEGAIREQFITVLAEKERTGCVVAPSPGMTIENLRTLAIIPGGEYEAEVARMREKGPVAACGDHGDNGALRFFVSQPEVTRTRFAFVDASQKKPWFDETSVRLMPDEVADAAVRDLPVTSLPLAERYAAQVEGRLDQLARKTGEFVEEQTTTTWAAFRDGAEVVLIVEQQERGDEGSASTRYFFRRGSLVLARGSGLGATHAGGRAPQAEILRAIAYGAEGAPVGARKSVSGKAAALEAGEEQAVQKRAALLLQRVQAR